MSSVNVVFVKDDCIYFARVHYRKLDSILAQGINTILPALRAKFLDAGYIIVDSNNKTIINGQRGIAVKKVKGWDLFDL